MILRRKKLENSKYFDERFPHASNKQKEQNREGELLKLHNRTKKKKVEDWHFFWYKRILPLVMA